MDKDSLVGIYNEWPTSKLLEEYAKVNDYEPVAIQAMKIVMLDRGLIEDMERLDAAYKAEEEVKEKRQEEEVLINKFAFAGDEKDFVKINKTSEGIHFRKKLQTRSQLIVSKYAKLITIITFLLTKFLGLLFFIKDMGGPILIGLAILTAYLIIYLVHLNNRTTITLFEEHGVNKLTLTRKKSVIKEFESPFNFEYFYIQESDYGLIKEGKDNYLVLLVSDPKGGESIELVEASSKGNTLMDDWELKAGGNGKNELMKNNWLSIRGDMKVGLEKLVRILKGINEADKKD